MSERVSAPWLFFIFNLLLFLATGCAPKEANLADTSFCAPTSLSAGVVAASGKASVFHLDPMISSGNFKLSPQSQNLDQYTVPVILPRLGGRGVLEGTYVDVRDNMYCNGMYGAYDLKNQFTYSHSDPRFQEAMSYFYGDQYRATIDSLGYLVSKVPVRVYAHYLLADNSSFYRGPDGVGQVRLYDSASTPGASYADDATVIVHELQHGSTVDLYDPDPKNYLNQFWYDEAGAMNEAVSDFMSLLFFQTDVLALGQDPKLFSRWALGSFSTSPHTRGANRCPVYDSAYASGCTNFPNFSADNNTVSYVYPDGLGWPYANNFKSPAFVKDAFNSYRSQEEIHNAGVLLEGALWDVAEAIRAAHGGDASVSHNLTGKLLLESLRHLGKPQTSPPANLSPVTFRGLAQSMMDRLSDPTFLQSTGMGATEQNAVAQALTQRGLYGVPTLTTDWAAVGPGTPAAPGVRIQDNPLILKEWLLSLGFSDQEANQAIPQGLSTGLNGQLDPGETAMIWFDVQDTSTITAGGVLITATSNDPDVQIYDPSLNIGAVSGLAAPQTQAQIRYGKINGTAIVSALASNNPANNVATRNSYFGTNPFYASSYNTGIFVMVSPQAAHKKVVNLQVTALPSNGIASTKNFPVTIN